MLLLSILRPLCCLLEQLAHLRHLKLKGTLVVPSAQNDEWPPVHAGRPLQLAKVNQRHNERQSLAAFALAVHFKFLRWRA